MRLPHQKYIQVHLRFEIPTTLSLFISHWPDRDYHSTCEIHAERTLNINIDKSHSMGSALNEVNQPTQPDLQIHSPAYNMAHAFTKLPSQIDRP
jgi:hypothetical protein